MSKNLTIGRAEIIEIPAEAARKMDTPTFMMTVVQEVANGGSMIALAARMDVHYEHMSRWISGDKERKSMYESALSMRGEWLAQKIINELRDLCFVDIKDAYDEDGNVKPIDEIPENIRRNIAGIEVFEEYQGEGKEREYIGQTKKIKLADKGQNLERLMKHLKMFVEEKRVVVSGEVRHSVQQFDLEARIQQLKESKPSAKVIEAEIVKETI